MIKQGITVQARDIAGRDINHNYISRHQLVHPQLFPSYFANSLFVKVAQAADEPLTF